MLALMFAAVLSGQALAKRVEAEPDVAAYRQELQAIGLKLSDDSGFAGDPRISGHMGCQASEAATRASIALFKMADPAPAGDPAGAAKPELDDAGRQAVETRARRYQQDAATLQLACLG